VSYILDALRKSDLQRQRSAAPTLLAVQATAVASKRPAYLAYGLLAAVLIGAGIVIGWLRPWEPEQAAPARPESVAVTPVESTARQPAPAPSEMAAQPKAEPELQNSMQPAQAPAPSEMVPKPQPKLQNAARPAQAAPAASAMAPKPELPARAMPQTDGPPRAAGAAAPGRTEPPAPERPVDSAAADAADLPMVISMAELPPSVRQELPAMKISVHAYSSNPGARLVSIDYRILREGDYLVPGLKLEQITPDGMIFDYKGYRFSHGVK
jgi:general secretion pathway protein B